MVSEQSLHPVKSPFELCQSTAQTVTTQSPGPTGVTLGLMQPVPFLISIPGPTPVLDLLLPQPSAAFSLASGRVATAPGGTEMVTGVLRTIKMLHWCVNWGLSPVSLKWSGTNKKYQ